MGEGYRSYQGGKDGTGNLGEKLFVSTMIEPTSPLRDWHAKHQLRQLLPYTDTLYLKWS